MAIDDPHPEHDRPARRRWILSATLGIAVLAAVVVVTVLAQRGDEPLTTVSQIRVIQASADGTTVQVDAGEPVELRLDENPTTGYLWGARTDNDDAVLRPTGDSWKVDDDCTDGMSGCGGVHTWRFEAGDEPGTGEVAFDLYSRTPGEVVEQFTVTVEVR